MKTVLKDHCFDRPPVLKDKIIPAESPTFQCNRTCPQRPAVSRHHTFMGNGVIFQDKFYCTYRRCSQAFELSNGIHKTPSSVVSITSFIFLGNNHDYLGLNSNVVYSFVQRTGYERCCSWFQESVWIARNLVTLEQKSKPLRRFKLSSTGLGHAMVYHCMPKACRRG